MKKLKIFLTMLFAALTMGATASSVTIGWNPSTDPEVLSYNVYYKLTNTNVWTTTNVVGRLNTTATLPVSQFALYQYYVTSVITNSAITGQLESEPSNQVRFQSFYVMGTKTTFMRVSDVNAANIPLFTAVTSPTKGALAGNPPTLAFTPAAGFDMDLFSYKNPEIFSGQNVTNYYGLVKLPTNPSTITTVTPKK
jgi:hypothetical protein